MILLLLVACAPATDAPATTAVDCSAAPTWDGWAHGFFVSYCGACHAADTPDRHGAPGPVSFDSEAQTRTYAETIRRTVIDEGSMPIAGGVFPADLDRLDRWLACP